MSGSAYRRVTTAIAIAGSLAIVSAMPSAAAAKSKKSSSLTKTEVIKLIKQYSKPGPAGRTGARGQTGPPGSYSIGAGLAQSGNTLQLAESACPTDEAIFGVGTNGDYDCGFATRDAVSSGAFGGNNGTQYELDNGAPTKDIASLDTPGPAGTTNTYWFMGTIDVFDNTANAAAVTCNLDEGPPATPTATFEQQETTVLGSSNWAELPMVWQVPVAADTSVEIECGANQTGISADATITAIPIG
jgi:hypothetical protein